MIQTAVIQVTVDTWVGRSPLVAHVRDQRLHVLGDLLSMDPTKFAGGWDDAVPQLRAVFSLSGGLANDRHCFSRLQLHLPAILSGASQVRSDVGDLVFTNDRRSGTVVQLIGNGLIGGDGVGGDPAVAGIGWANAQPSIRGFHVNLQLLTNPKSIGSVKVTSRPASRVGGGMPDIHGFASG
ncbi:MAG: hypothetical protein AAFP90_08190 [Planctomycetota bacterium]